MQRTGHRHWTRRRFLAAAGAGATAAAAGAGVNLRAADGDRALVAITLDLEMSRNFPARTDTHWDFEKGNLNDETKRYTVEACRRVKAAGGVLQLLRGRPGLRAASTGSRRSSRPAIPSATTPTTTSTCWPRGRRTSSSGSSGSWLIAGRAPSEVIRDNIRLVNSRRGCRRVLGIATPAGLSHPRWPSPTGCERRPDLREMLRAAGLGWVSSLYPRHPNTPAGEEPGATIYDSIVRAQADAQPFVYPDGLIEIPMSPDQRHWAPSSTGRWQLESFWKAIDLAGLTWATRAPRPSSIFLAIPHACTSPTPSSLAPSTSIYRRLVQGRP